VEARPRGVTDSLGSLVADRRALDALRDGLRTVAAELCLNPESEWALTALADLALLERARVRLIPDPVARAVSRGIGVVLDRQGCPDGGSTTRAWALMAAGAWVGRISPCTMPEADRVSRRMIRFGPSWRADEVTYFRARLGGPLPALRPVSTSSIGGLQELAHVAFFASDFGAYRLRGGLASELGKHASGAAIGLRASPDDYDLVLELVLASRWLTGRLEPVLDDWARRLVPAWTFAAAEAIGKSANRYRSLYHALAQSSLLITQITVDGGSR